MPDVTLFLDVAPEIGLKRIYKNNEREKNRLDLETRQFHEKVYEGYKQVLKRFPERIKRVDATLPFSRVLDDVFSIVQHYVNEKR